MVGVIEDVAEVARWAKGIEGVHECIAGRFRRPEPRRGVLDYLRGLLSPVERKKGWQLAEQAGDATPYGVQRLLAVYHWDADEVRDDLQGYVVEHLGDPGGVLVVDETGFLKQGRKSVGVKRQYSGTAGKVENCQIGVFLAYCSRRGAAFLDRELYLPQEWAKDVGRRREAGVPSKGWSFRTKAQLARRDAGAARWRSGVPFGWVTGDTKCTATTATCGGGWSGETFPTCWRSGATSSCGQRRTRDGDRCGRTGWRLGWRNPAGCGAARATAPRDPGYKGPRVYDWARVELRPLKEPGQGYWRRVRRSIAKPGELAYYVCFGPVDTTLEEPVRVAGTRWTIAECFEEAKGEVGLDQYEVRKWDGWYRHITLAMLAHACLAVVRRQALEPGGPGAKGAVPAGTKS